MRSSTRLRAASAAASAAAAVLVLVGCSGDAAPRGQAPASSPVGSPAAATTTGKSTTGGSTTGSTVQPEVDLPDPPGDLHEVDGHAMHLHCTGEGSPTVLLEAGLGDLSLSYTALREELSSSTRVCAYDRAGHGWSEPGPEPRTGAQMVEELMGLLATAEEAGPYVLVGHSLGGLVVLLFAEQHPEDVAGVVLVDASHPDQEELLHDALPGLDDASREELAYWDDVARRAEAGDLHPSETLFFTRRTLPVAVREQMALLLTRPEPWRTTIAEYDAFDRTREQVGDASLGDVPLVVIAAGLGYADQMSSADLDALDASPEELERVDAVWRDLQEDHATRSTDARLVVAEHSGHEVHLDEPDIVVEAVLDLVGAG